MRANAHRQGERTRAGAPCATPPAEPDLSIWVPLGVCRRVALNLCAELW